MKKIAAADDMITVEISRKEVAALADIGLEVINGYLKTSDIDWEMAYLPVTKPEAQKIFDDLRALL